MLSRFQAGLRVLALLAAVTLLAALSSGVIQPIQAVTGAPGAQRYPPEEFQGTVVAGSVSSIGGVVQFVLDRPRKIGNTFDPTQREQVPCQLEGVPTDQIPLVADGSTIYVGGTYDPVLGRFFVDRVGLQPAPIVVPAQPTVFDNTADNGDDNGDDDSDSEDNDDDNGDNDDEDNDSEDNDDDNGDDDNGDNDDEDNDSEDNEDEDEDNDDEDNDDEDEDNEDEDEDNDDD